MYLAHKSAHPERVRKEGGGERGKERAGERKEGEGKKSVNEILQCLLALPI